MSRPDRTVGIDLGRQVAKALIAQAPDINDATPEDIDLLARDLIGEAVDRGIPVDDAAAFLVARLQGKHPQGFWKRALAMYLALLRRDGVTGEFRKAI